MLGDVESLRVMWSHLEEIGTRMEASISSDFMDASCQSHPKPAIRNSILQGISLCPLGDPVHTDDFKVYDDHAVPYAKCIAMSCL